VVPVGERILVQRPRLRAGRELILGQQAHALSRWVSPGGAVGPWSETTSATVAAQACYFVSGDGDTTAGAAAASALTPWVM